MLAGSARKLAGIRAQTLLQSEKKPIESCLKRCLDAGTSITERNLVIQLQEGSLTVDFYASPLLEDASCPSVLVEMQKVDRHLRISRDEQLQSQQHAVRLLVRGLAHEIKNPLGGLRGAAQLLEKELSDGDLNEYTQVIIDESDRLKSLVDRMLGPNKPPQKSLLNIHHALERVRHLVEAEKIADVAIKCDYDPSIPQVFCDGDQLIQAVLNVVRNAMQAVNKQGKITLYTRVVRNMTLGNQCYKIAARIDVIDNGSGIDPDMMESVFYPMVTSRPNGSGLGLSIAQSLISQNGGMIQCSSTPGNTVFSIFLPLDTGNASA